MHRVPARVLNPDAGDHAVTSHPAEIEASIEATRRSYEEFPYLERRYGERGRRFTLSDSGWIATLCESPLAHAREQILWLGGLLAARGMPRYLLERHLVHLEHALVTALPERRSRYEILGHCASHLAGLRAQWLAEERFEALAAGFERAVLECPERVENMGRLLLAAAIDEAGQVAYARSSLETWACDPERFS